MTMCFRFFLSPGKFYKYYWYLCLLATSVREKYNKIFRWKIKNKFVINKCVSPVEKFNLFETILWNSPIEFH